MFLKDCCQLSILIPRLFLTIIMNLKPLLHVVQWTCHCYHHQGIPFTYFFLFIHSFTHSFTLRLKPRSKMEHFDDGDKVKELSYLIGFGNIFCVIKQENLDSKLYKDFILDFATRVVEGNTSCIVRHWTGSGQTAATDRRELLYRVECERPKVMKNTKSTSPILEMEQNCGALSGNKRKFAEDDSMASVSTTVKPSAPYLLGNLNTKKNIQLIESKVESIIGSEFKYPTMNTDNISDVDTDLLLEIFNPEFPIFGVLDSNYTFTI